MSKMSQIHMEITQRINDGDAPDDIVDFLIREYGFSYPTAWEFVNDLIDAEHDEYDDSMDGDFDSGMASAGFGTDEDYGYFGDE